MTDLLRSVGQGEAQACVNADAARDRQVWDQQAAARKELQEQLASFFACHEHSVRQCVVRP